MRCIFSSDGLLRVFFALSSIFLVHPNISLASGNDDATKEVRAFCKSRKDLLAQRLKLDKFRLDEIASCYKFSPSSFSQQKCEKIRGAISTLLVSIKRIEGKASQADLDQNGVLDDADMSFIGRCLNEVGAAVDCGRADFNHDGVVSLADTVVFTAYRSCNEIGLVQQCEALPPTE